MSSTTSRLVRRSAGAVVASALSLSALAVISPAYADTGTWLVGGTSGATLVADDAVVVGNTIHLEGSGWTDGSDDSAADGSWVAIKLGAAGSGDESSILTTEPAAGQFTFPGSTTATGQIWSGVQADDSGNFSVDVPFPTLDNTTDVFTDPWDADEVHHLQLLTGSMKPTGDTPRSVYVTFTVEAPAATATVKDLSSTYSASAGSAALSGSGFTEGTVLTAQVDGADVQFGSGRGNSTKVDTITVPAGGVVSGYNLVLPADLRAGSHTVTITGDDGTNVSATLTVSPALAWSNDSEPGKSGTLTISGLPTGAVISSVRFGETTIASSLSAADAAGTATGDYAIPTSIAPGQQPTTITQTTPDATYTLSTTIYPNETVFGADKYTIASDSNDPALFQGLYQSGYSKSRDALYASAGNRGSGEGYLYKLDPNTLAVEASAHASDDDTVTDRAVDPDGVYATAPFGLGVDDVNGNVWVTNTGGTGVAVYDADDLTLLKQYPEGTIDHPRDAVYDPKTNTVFVSSASEGSSGNGYLEVFEAADNDEDGTPYELIKKVQTGPRSEFNPVSISIDAGKLYSPSLSSDKVAEIDTETAVDGPEVAAGELDASVTLIELGDHSTAGNGRGASGIAYDAADNRIFVASQNENGVYVADATSGEVIKFVSTGQQALNVAYDKVNHLAYVTNFGGTTITVLDKDGNKVAALPVARANHVTVTDAGVVYAVDKATPVNHVWKITPKPTQPTPPNTGGDHGDTTPPAVHLTPQQKKVAKAAARVAGDKAKIRAIKAKIKQAKKAHHAKAVKRLQKKLAHAKTKLKKDKKALAKAKKKLRKSRRK